MNEWKETFLAIAKQGPIAAIAIYLILAMTSVQRELVVELRAIRSLQEKTVTLLEARR